MKEPCSAMLVAPEAWKWENLLYETLHLRSCAPHETPKQVSQPHKVSDDFLNKSYFLLVVMAEATNSFLLPIAMASK